jgi:hypothetical protein
LAHKHNKIILLLQKEKDYDSKNALLFRVGGGSLGSPSPSGAAECGNCFSRSNIGTTTTCSPSRFAALNIKKLTKLSNNNLKLLSFSFSFHF